MNEYTTYVKHMGDIFIYCLWHNEMPTAIHMLVQESQVNLRD